MKTTTTTPTATTATTNNQENYYNILQLRLPLRLPLPLPPATTCNHHYPPATTRKTTATSYTFRLLDEYGIAFSRGTIVIVSFPSLKQNWFASVWLEADSLPQTWSMSGLDSVKISLKVLGSSIDPKLLKMLVTVLRTSRNTKDIWRNWILSVVAWRAWKPLKSPAFGIGRHVTWICMTAVQLLFIIKQRCFDRHKGLELNIAPSYAKALLRTVSQKKSWSQNIHRFKCSYLGNYPVSVHGNLSNLHGALDLVICSTVKDTTLAVTRKEREEWSSHSENVAMVISYLISISETKWYMTPTAKA